jgi:predicted DNA-binding protein
MASYPDAAPLARPARKPARRASPLPKWMKPFLAALADTSNVTAAARKAGVTTSVVYERRRADHEFNRRWQVALCEGYDNLEMELLHRLRSGEVKPATAARKGARSFDNATAFRLLSAHRESATRTKALRDNVDAATIRASIDRKVAEMRDRVLAAKAEREAAAASSTGLLQIEHQRKDTDEPA